MISDDGNSIYFVLNPADISPLIPEGKSSWAPKDFEWASQDCVWLYRHLRSASDEEKLLTTPCFEQDLKPMAFGKPPEFKLLWADSGQSVALYLNGQPWAFIEETTRLGYSKGMIKPRDKNAWNQELFERTFIK